MTDIKVRKLNAGDIYRVATLVSSELDLINEIAKRRDGEGQEEYQTRVGGELLKAISGRHLAELWDWIADLAGMTVEELNQSPMDTPLVVIEEVIGGDDVAGFTAAVRKLAQKLTAKRAG